MRKKLKLGKLLAVIFLTVLIWVWADIRQDETYTVEGAKITVARPADSWVRLNGGDSVTIDKLVFKGPLSNINNLKAKEAAGTFQTTFTFDPKTERIVTEGERQIDVAGFIAAQAEVKDLGVSVESCEPKQMTANIVPLTPKLCQVKAIDEYGNTLNQAKTDPSEVQMPAPNGETLVAYVKLTDDEITQSQTEPVEKNPFIRLENQTRTTNESVRVTLPAQGNNMREHLSVPAVLYIAYTQNMHEKYKAVVKNPTDLSSVSIRATPEAYAAYSEQSNKLDESIPQITLYVWDDDVKEEGKTIRRNVVYNFPREYVRRGQIEIEGVPKQAEFELVPIGSNSPQ